MIKYLIMDVDGTLTDGNIYIGEKGECFKVFNIKDGYGIAHILKDNNIEPIIITGRKSVYVENRCKELGIHKVYQGRMDKLNLLKEILGGESMGECAYIGDDIPDLECMREIKRSGGKTGCPNDAVKEIIEVSSYVCKKKAGDGAVREFIEWLVL